MDMEIGEVEEVKELLKNLGEERLLKTLESFESLWKELKTKNGEDYARLVMLSFMEGMLVSLRDKHGDARVGRLHKRVKMKRSKLDERFRKPKMGNLQ